MSYVMIPVALLALAVGAAGGFWLGADRPDLATLLAAEPPVPAAATAGAEREILYYRNPMGLPDISYEPKKDSMGMDYLPVYADEAAAEGDIAVSPSRMQILGVRTAPVVRRPILRVVRAVAAVEPDERRTVMVTPRIEGWVEKLHVNETGRGVARGEPLMDVYSPELLRAQANYLLALAGGQPEDLAGAGYRLTSMGLSAEQVALLHRTRQIQRTVTIPAPAAGTVLAKSALEGMMFRPGDQLFTIADLTTVVLMVDVFEQDIAALREGAGAAVAVAAFPGEVFRGTVDRIYPSLDARTRTAKVRITLDNRDGRLRGGMLATAEITSGEAEAPVVAVPDSAVIDSGRRKVVLVETGPGRFRPMEISTGRRGDGHTQVLAGLTGGERVVVGATFLIDAESNIRSALTAFTAGETQEVAP